MAGRHDTPLGYCDQVDVENYLLLTIDPTFDEQIDDWITAAEKQVNNYLGYTTASGIFLEQVDNEVTRAYVDSDSNLRIFPRKPPIQSVSAIDLIKGSDVLSLSLTTSGSVTRYNIPSTNDYILYPDKELSFTGTSILGTFNQLRGTSFFTRIDYIGGFTTVPADIRMATTMLVSDIVMRHSNKEGLEQITQGRVTKRWHQRNNESDFSQDAKQLLNPYRIASRWI